MLRTTFDMCTLKCSDIHSPQIGTRSRFVVIIIIHNCKANLQSTVVQSTSQYYFFSVFMFLEPGFPIWLNPIWWHDIVSEKGLGTHTCTADGLEKGHYAWQKAGLSFRMICKKGTLCQINSLFCIEVTQREEVVPYRIQ